MSERDPEEWAVVAQSVVTYFDNEPSVIMVIGVSLLARVWHRLGCPPLDTYLRDIRKGIERHPLPIGFGQS